MEIRQVPITHPDAAALVASVQQEYVARYGGPDETPLEPQMFEPPTGAFYVGYVDGVAVATGAWRRRSDVRALGRWRTAEMKRVYVVPPARRRGLAARMLVHLQDTARDAGADLMVLETGLKQPEALAMYAAQGYEPVPAFGHYAWSPSARYLGKRL